MIARRPRVILRVTKVSPAARRLVVEEDAVDGEHAVGFAVVDRHASRRRPWRRRRGCGDGRAWSRVCGVSATLPNISLLQAW